MLVCLDGSLVFVVVLFCPPGFSVVVVLEVLWANPAVPSAKLNPKAATANFEICFMVFLRFMCRRSVGGFLVRRLDIGRVAGETTMSPTDDCCGEIKAGFCLRSACCATDGRRVLFSGPEALASATASRVPKPKFAVMRTWVSERFLPVCRPIRSPSLDVDELLIRHTGAWASSAACPGFRCGAPG